MASLQLDRIGFFQTRKYVFIFMYWNHWIQTSQTRHKYPNSVLMTNNKNRHYYQLFKLLKSAYKYCFHYISGTVPSVRQITSFVALVPECCLASWTPCSRDLLVRARGEEQTGLISATTVRSFRTIGPGLLENFVRAGLIWVRTKRSGASCRGLRSRSTPSGWSGIELKQIWTIDPV